MQRIAFKQHNNSWLICLGLLLGCRRESVPHRLATELEAWKLAFARAKQNGARIFSYQRIGWRHNALSLQA